MPEEQKKGSFIPIFIITAASILIAALWNQIPAIKNSVDSVLNPTLGALLKFNINLGVLVIIFFITLITTLIQKYTTDQKALRELKEEQKKISEEMKLHRDNPQKMGELSKKQMEFFPRTMKLTSRSIMFTGIPLILFYRWFNDIFVTLGNPLIFGFMGWFVAYLIFTMIFSGILRKVMNVA